MDFSGLAVILRAAFLVVAVFGIAVGYGAGLLSNPVPNEVECYD